MPEGNVYKKTHVWKNTMSSNEEYIERLCVSYKSVWDYGIEIASKINEDFPDLTLHDKNHFDALWQNTDFFMSEDFKLNAIELYMYGCSLIIHDLGHAIDCYPGGLDELKASEEYKDALYLFKSNNPSIVDVSRDVESSLLLNVVRQKHAAQSKYIASNKINGRYIIEDDEIRNFLAPNIGRICASHGDDIKYLDGLFKPIGAPSFINSNSYYNCGKIACLLRCVDASQIDGRRTTSNLRRRNKPSGNSIVHWDAQEVERPVLQKHNNMSFLVFNSGRSFDAERSMAWWTLFSLVKNADHEIIKANKKLKEHGLDEFGVAGVYGCETPEEFSGHVPVSGWRPSSLNVKPEKVGRLIELLGGENLYGSDLTVPIRELIQNSADAIRFRSHLDEDFDLSGGQIHVSIVLSEQGVILEFKDNGIGMTEDEVFEYLLTLGKSSWSSKEYWQSFPGKSFVKSMQSGKFGIGFFSCIMLSKDIIVSTRRYDQGRDKVSVVHVLLGDYVQSSIIDASEKDFSSRHSTMVKLNVEKDVFENLLNRGILADDILEEEKLTEFTPIETVKTRIQRLFKLLSVGLDVKLSVSVNDLNFDVHRKDVFEMSVEEYIERLRMFGGLLRVNFDIETYLKKINVLMEVVERSDGTKIGRAALGFNSAELGLTLIDRFPRMYRSVSQSFVGLLFASASNTSRFAYTHSTENLIAIRFWAEKQIKIIMKNILFSNVEKYIALQNAIIFGADEINDFIVFLNGEYVNINDLINKFNNNEEIFFPVEDSKFSMLADDHDILKLSDFMIRVEPNMMIGIDVDHRVNNVNFVLPGIHFHGNDRYRDINHFTKNKSNSNNLFNLILRAIEQSGVQIKINMREVVVAELPEKYFDLLKNRYGVEYLTSRSVKQNCVVMRRRSEPTS
jgi:hypothetical protein